MESTNPQSAATRTAPAPRRSAAIAHLRRRTRWRLGGVAWAFVVTVWLAAPPPAAACSWWNPAACFVEVGDYLWEQVKGVLELTWDVITLNPEEFFEDFKDVAYNEICWGLTPLSLALSAGVEEDFDECASPPHPIEPDILAELGLYFKSSFDSVRIHEGCNLDGDYTPGSRNAITFGEHIYFEDHEYNPGSPEGFALLAHELTHVLQYRKKGFADFTCEFGLDCAFGANESCAIEKEADNFQALVFKDQDFGGDGNFSNNECKSGETKHEACAANTHQGVGYDYECDNGNWKKVGGWCERIPPPDCPLCQPL
jgi:Domain of unknown function (DUF4157)